MPKADKRKARISKSKREILEVIHYNQYEGTKKSQDGETKMRYRKTELKETDRQRQIDEHAARKGKKTEGKR